MSAGDKVHQALQLALKHDGKPFAIILAGHNGSGKSTLWYRHVADDLRIPLINADRMMLSILPETKNGRLCNWAEELRDTNEAWMRVAQQGVEAFVAASIGSKVPFAMETVFSHWAERPDGTVESKIDRIIELQLAGYFVLLIFVGLTNVDLSIGRVETRASLGGHPVPHKRLRDRFPRTQKAIRKALDVADAAILFDNSRSQRSAFTPVHIRRKTKTLFDLRTSSQRPDKLITTWLDIVAPM